jgi:PHD-finger
MVQCETCKVWQHGLCMGYEAEDQLPDDDYHCEQCRPDLHQDLIKLRSFTSTVDFTLPLYFRKLSKRSRGSATALQAAAITNRHSRSHSPTYPLKPTKRRNTMNSRDANFDITLKETLAATAAEARAAAQDDGEDSDVDPEESVDGSKKKRKRPEDELVAYPQCVILSCLTLFQLL